MTTPRVSLVVPVFNEEAGVEHSLRTVRDVLNGQDEPFEIVVVDDGSNDRTREILGEIDGIRVVANPRNLGYGAAVKRGVRASQGEWILITDGDASYPASNLPRLLDHLGRDGMDMVVGARSLGSIHNPALWNGAKVFFQSVLSRLLGASIPDINSGMRLFRRDLAISMEGALLDGFSYSSGLTVTFLRQGLRVAFEPIEYIERKGHSKVRPLSFSAAFLRSVTRAWMVGRR